MTKVGETKLIDGHIRTDLDIIFADFMAKELAKRRPEPRQIPDTFNGKPIKELSPTELEEFYFSMQPESTKQAIMRQRSRKPEEDLDFLLRPIAPEYLANPEAKDHDSLTNARTLKPTEVLLEEGLRRKARNTLGDSKQSSISPEAKERGIHAFTYSKPANVREVDFKRLMGIKPIEAAKPDPSIQIEEKKPKGSWWKFWSTDELNDYLFPKWWKFWRW